MLKIERPQAQAIALDFSPTMLQAARERFANDPTITVVELLAGGVSALGVLGLLCGGGTALAIDGIALSALALLALIGATDAEPGDPFDFYPDRYIDQLVAGYSRNTHSGGLIVFFPDYDKLPRLHALAPPHRGR